MNSTLGEEQAQIVLVNVYPVLVLNVIHWEDDHKTGQLLIMSALAAEANAYSLKLLCLGKLDIVIL